MIRRFVPFMLSLTICLLNFPLANAGSFPEGLRAEPERSYSPRQQSQTAPVQPATDKQAEKAARQIRQIGIGGPITLYLKNGDELHGTVSKIDQDSMQVSEIDRHDNFMVRYSEIRKVRSGAGNKNVFTGKRVTRSHGLRIAGLIIAAGIIAIPLIIVATTKD